jgi:hypothetical protein
VGHLPDRRRPSTEALNDLSPERVSEGAKHIVSHYAKYKAVTAS